MKKIFITIQVLCLIASINALGAVELQIPTNEPTIASHSKKADADYDKVFASNKIQRIDIIIDPEIYSQMVDNMTDQYGEQNISQPGGRGRPAGNPPAGNPPAGNPPAGNPPTGNPPEGNTQRPTMAANSSTSGGLQYISDSINPEYFEATLIYDSYKWEHIGIRYKGNSSLKSSWQMGSKNLPLRFNFDYFEDDYPETDDQRFFGFKKMTMGTMYQDQTLIHEMLASDLFNESGVSVARSSFYEVYINTGDGSQFIGLYTMIEDPSDYFLKNNFGDDKGKLYKPEGEGAWLSFYDEENYEEKLEETTDHSELSALIDHLNDYNMEGKQWREKLEELFNIESFISFLAVNNTIVNWDTYGVAPHNFYLYSDSESGRFTYIPWDLNESFNFSPKAMSLSMEEVDETWPLISRIKNDPVYMKLYYEKLSHFVNGPFSSESITTKLTLYEKLVAKYRGNSVDMGRRNVSIDLSDFIEERRDSVLNFLENKK